MIRYISIFISTLFLSAHFGALLYVNSTLLSRFFSPEVVSILFVLGALGNIVLFLFTPQLIERFGKRMLLVIFLLVSTISTLGLAFAETSSVALLSFLLYSSVFLMTYYIFDIFLEEITKDTKTGEIRGLYLTVMNLGIALGPLLLAFTSSNEALRPVYLLAGALLVVPILISAFVLRSNSPKWHGLHQRHHLLPFKTWWRTKSVRRATISKLVLEIFFAMMTIYIPVYLHTVLGFAWTELGIMFTIMLLPFIIFEWPVGEVADRWFGEKELMIIGFILMGASVLLMPYLGSVFIFWTSVLFVSRMGASLVEITSESYFFKHVDGEDIRLISIFRLARPAGIIFGAILGVLTVNLLSFDKIFVVTAIVIFFGLKEALVLKDTK